jgi:DNA helicase-2/ATP-dependent DNA helicase PcrA
MAEERRLAYVAATRAAFWLGGSGYWWGDGSARLGPSAFLTEIREVCQAGGGVVSAWADEPPQDAVNPALAEPATAVWPALGSAAEGDAAEASAAAVRLAAVRAAADLVEQALAEQAPAKRDLAEPGRAEQAVAEQGLAEQAVAEQGPAERDLATPNPGLAEPDPAEAEPAGIADDLGAYRELAESWASEADLLLAERARGHRGGQSDVALPRQLPVSALVTVARDPAELAQQVRRPMPRPPAPHALRGTEFHRWLEERFGQPQLIDADELPGAADDSAGAEPDAGLAGLKAAFEASEWADRQPLEIEVPFETLIGDRIIRGRIDAVFADAADRRYDVVDWKTGRRPSSAAERRAVAVQLAAYRLAWADLVGVPVSAVRAAFYYVRESRTVRPADLMDEAGLAALIAGIPAAEPAPAG